MKQDIQRRIKKRRLNQKPSEKNEKIKGIFFRILIVGVLTISALITLKAFPNWKEVFYTKVFQDHFSFAPIHAWYEKTFGSPMPWKDLLKDPLEPVFKEELYYTHLEPYQNGVKLTVENSYLVPSYESGMVIFVGEKEGYGNVVIIEQTDGVEVWYGNLSSIPIKVYDYLEKGSLVGQTKDNTLFLVFMKEGNYLPYEDYLSV